MTSMSSSATRKSLRATYDEALSSVPEALQSEGFGVITSIDIQSTLKQKLGVDFRRYKILGACNPQFALEGLRADLGIGVMLPCNVVVYEDDHGQAVVLAIDPTKTMAPSGDTRLAELAEAVKRKLARALERLV